MYIIIFVLCLVVVYSTSVILDKTKNVELNRKKKGAKGKGLWEIRALFFYKKLNLMIIWKKWDDYMALKITKTVNVDNTAKI